MATTRGAPQRDAATTAAPHPVVWLILYLPFGALGGFVQIALTFLATQHGLSISEGALLNGAQLLSQWLKWLWAPLVDITLSPKRWYVISTSASALGVIAMAAMPMSPDTLGALLAVIAIASLVNSVVGMAVESLIASSTTPDQVGRVSAWFQAGNMAGNGLGGGLGLFLMSRLPAPWMTGLVMAVLFMACCLVLRFTVEAPHPPGQRALGAVKAVVSSLWEMLKTKGGLLSAILCVLPVGTGAAVVVLTQSKVAAHWGASAGHVALLQGLLAGIITAVGCFAGGWLCQRLPPRTAYMVIGMALAAVATALALAPATVTTYVIGSLVYSFFVGLAYAAFTAVVLVSMGPGAAATKYNVFASLSNFPIWWVGLLLGFVADRFGPNAMLLGEAALGVAGVAVFVLAAWLVNRSRLAASPVAIGP